jgi:exopolysaccharide biosynthesis WecB/TagA/CpsF family protein
MQQQAATYFSFTPENATPVSAAGPVPALQRVCGADLLSATQADAISILLQPGRRQVFFYNAHCANERARNPAYAAALSRADLILPDGIGIDIAARMQGEALASNLNGTDLTPLLLREAAKQGKSVFLFGGRPGTAERAAQNICRQVPGLKVAGTRDGYDGAADAAGAVAAINESGADILLVALGVPLQELWLDRHAGMLKPELQMAVGGLLDFWAGNVKRAPALVRRARSEWIWRLMMEPRRLARRYLIGNAAFLLRAASEAWQDRDPYEVRKRSLDIVLSSVALLVLTPLLLLICAAIRAESAGPALFRQQRTGRNGRVFTLYKFRSMYSDAEARRASLLASSDRAGICFKSRSDPRVTRIGKILRRYSLDELPQLLNILAGDMSVVGPRPALTEEVAAYSPHARQRLSARPGLTGIWQVSGRADIDFDRMVEMDISYARSRSILLDMILIGATFRAVATGKGAY